MAARLLSENIAGSSNSPLLVWNRTSSKCDELKSKFGDKELKICGSAKDVVEGSDIVL